MCYGFGMATLEQSPTAGRDEPAEEALVSRLKQGDEVAFVEVMRAYAPRLLAVARRYLGSEEDAQDALQDALLSAFRAIGRFESEARLSTWLHRITINASLMKLRSRKRSAERPIEELLPRFLSDGHRAQADGRWTMTIDTAVQSREACDVVRSCIDRLPETYRTILLLRDIDERSTEETAALLGIDPGAVKTRLHRARQALRTLLDPYMRGGDA
jgi:RNA polymerase sigma-70 factor (ECF subfamily)